MAEQATYDAFREYGLILRFAKNSLLETKEGRKFVDKVALATDLLENYVYGIIPNERGMTSFGKQSIADLFSGPLDHKELDKVKILLQGYNTSLSGVRECLRDGLANISEHLTLDQNSACEKLLK